MLKSRTILLSLLLTFTYGTQLPSQNPDDSTFSAYKATTLSTSAEVFTVLKPASATKNARFISLYAYCSVACTVTLERNGIFTTGNVITVVNMNPANVLANTTQSFAYSGTTISAVNVVNVYNIPAAGWVSIDASKYELPGSKLDNLTMRTNSITGNVVLQAVWREL